MVGSTEKNSEFRSLISPGQKDTNIAFSKRMRDTLEFNLAMGEGKQEQVI